LKLTCYPTSNLPPKIIRAPLERAWMDATNQAFAYRCLPLNIANAHGWLILSPVGCTAEWNGRSGVDAIRLEVDGDPAGDAQVSSHFGDGILTFQVNGLFRTEPGYDLIATGPFNHVKDAIQPLTGVIEADWSPFTFTMNWKFTRKFAPIRFEVDEPICMIMPYNRSDLEETQPAFRPMSSDLELKRRYDQWSVGRRKFNRDLLANDETAKALGWQKDYFRGRGDYGRAPDSHRTKVRVRDFEPLLEPVGQGD
jgi:uncharacterized protein DUF6065